MKTKLLLLAILCGYFANVNAVNGPVVASWCTAKGGGGDYYTKGQQILYYAGIAIRDNIAQYPAAALVTFASINSANKTLYGAYIAASDTGVLAAARMAYLTGQTVDVCTLGTGGDKVGDKNSRFIVGINIHS